jgi:hypothetical protein
MEPELDVIANGRERHVPRAHTPNDPTAPIDPTDGPRRRVPRLRWAGPVAAVLLLAAVAVFVATRPGEPDATAAEKVAAAPTTAPPKPPLSFEPQPQPDNRPVATVPAALHKNAVLALGPAREGVTVSVVDLIGSDYRSGKSSLGVLEEAQAVASSVTVDLVCVGTGTARVWIQGQSGGSDAGPPTLIDCANPEPARITRTMTAAGFFVYANLDPQTVAVLAYVAIISVEIE